jgi:O-antigen/teichoic acid export membrane protein
MAYEGFLLALVGAASMILMLTAIHYGANTCQILWALTGAYALMTVIAYSLLIRRFTTPQFRIDLPLCKTMVKQALPIGLAVFLAMAYGSAGTVALEAMRDPREVGLFGAATKLARNLNAFPMIFAGIILPIFTKHVDLGESHLATTYTWALRFMMLLGFPLAAGGFALADQIIMLIYGVEFTAASAALRIAIWSLPCYYLSYVSKTLLEARNQQTLWTATLGISLILNIALNIALVPSLGASGASLALMLTDLMILISSYHFVAREIPHDTINLGSNAARALMCALLMGIAMYLAREAGLVIATALGLTIYIVLIRVLNVLNQEEWATLMNAVSLRVSSRELR